MFEIERIIRTALQEDIGLGDITTQATIAAGTVARAELVAKQDFVLGRHRCGPPGFHLVGSFRSL